MNKNSVDYVITSDRRWIFCLLVSTILIMVLTPFPILARENKTLVLNVTSQPPLHRQTHDGFMDEISRMALKNVGYQLVIERFPAERGLRNANAGLIDGDMGRVKGIDKLYPNLIRVPEKIMNWEFCVFSKKKIDLLQGWKSLANKNVAFITGWKILEKNVPTSALITKSRDAQQLFMLVNKDRVSLAIYERWGGNYILKTLKNNNIKLQRPCLATKEIFIYLHKKHSALVPRLAQALADMKKDGRYRLLVKKHLKISQTIIF